MRISDWSSDVCSSDLFALLLPPLVCLPVAVLAELAKVWERLQQEGLWNAVLFYRASEVQELYFCFFILFYLMVFRQRVLARRVAGLPARPDRKSTRLNSSH